ncbi:MAG: cysteine desulfurase [Kiritimatiellae bacterium]|nr:cysteine desulfurase [Kiritimatiellia bacterium]MDW8458340.1 cysteine desulfurase [Verrucomicrobiota bacterium]
MNLAPPAHARGLDVAAVRRDFPILDREVYPGRRLIYLDNAATSQKPRAVLDAMQRFYLESNANVHRAIHRLAEEATDAYEQARRSVARLLNAPEERCVVFTRGATEAINLVAHAWGDRHIGAGDVILVTEMEHHSNLVPWQMLARRVGASVAAVPVTDRGELDLDAFDRLLTGRVKLFAFTHVSNVLGTVNPVRELSRRARAVGAAVLVDGAQSVPHMPVDVQALDCDFLAFSGHKMCGPTGIGALYIKAERLDEMDPFLGGGEMISRVTIPESTWAEPPHKFEAGTPNIAGAVGLGAAAEYLLNLGLEAVHEYERELAAHARMRLAEIPGLTIYGCAPERGGAISFEMAGIHPHDLAHFVDRDGIAIRAGHMCAQPLLRRLGVQALSRASMYLYNTTDEIDALARSLLRARDFFGRGTG